jgi:hypothetical protein
MANYVLLIFGDPQQWDEMTPEQAKAHDAAHEAFHAAAGSQVVGGGALEPAPVATTLRSDGRDGVIMTDGPFLETKEAVGGYYLLEASDLDEVIKLASLLPEVHASHSAVEIRLAADQG